MNGKKTRTVILGLTLAIGVAVPAAAVEPIYVSIVMHNEEPGGMFPDYLADPAVFVASRNRLVAFATMLSDHGVMFNWQADWNFLLAVDLYDTGPPSTNNKNVVRWLKEDLGFEVDPHAHETPGYYNYADVAFLIQSLGVPPSHTVGGMVVFPPADSSVERFRDPIVGWQFPAYSWQAAILWGGGTSLHVSEDHLWASGIWKPRDNEHFLMHSPAAPLPNVGKYQARWMGLQRLIDMQNSGELVDGKMYTISITVGQIELDADSFLPLFESNLIAMEAAGDLRWVGVAEAVAIWNSQYASQPNILRRYAFGDWNRDEQVDGTDAGEFDACRTGPDPVIGPDTACYPFDYEPDYDVDCADWSRFEAAWTGTGSPPAAPTGCAPGSVDPSAGFLGVFPSLAPGDLDLMWPASCSTDASDYAVYEGVLGAWYSHVPKLCSTGGATSATITPAPGPRYYLVVPLAEEVEGSYGVNSLGVERPPVPPLCAAGRLLTDCP